MFIKKSESVIVLILLIMRGKSRYHSVGPALNSREQREFRSRHGFPRGVRGGGVVKKCQKLIYVK